MNNKNNPAEGSNSAKMGKKELSEEINKALLRYIELYREYDRRLKSGEDFSKLKDSGLKWISPSELMREVA